MITNEMRSSKNKCIRKQVNTVINALKPKPCPAGNCDAELYSNGEFVFCPVCKGKNPNYVLSSKVPRAMNQVATTRRTRKEPVFDPITMKMTF